MKTRLTEKNDLVYESYSGRSSKVYGTDRRIDQVLTPCRRWGIESTD